MTNFVDAISAAESVNTKVEKLKALSGLDDVAKQLVFDCLSPYRVFGVKKWPAPKQYATVDGDFGEFLQLLNKLADRTLTGNAARDAVTETLSKYTERTASYLRRVLIKKIDCGATATTFNKLYPGLVPVYKVSACRKRTAATKIIYPKIADAKLDGQRVTAFVSPTSVVYLSRSGKPASFCEGLFDDELLELRQSLNYDIVVDGEVMGTNFTTTMNAKGSKSDEQQQAKQTLKFYVFDLLSWDVWSAAELADTRVTASEPQSKRTELIQKLLGEKPKDYKLQRLMTATVNSDIELTEFFDRCVALKYEGVIIKDPDAPYVCDRKEHWYKWKPVLDLDLKIVGFLPGAPDGMFANTVGAVLLEGHDENGLHIITECGTGFTIEQRDDMKLHPEKYLGKIAEIEVQEITPPTDGRTWHSTRFSSFKRIRDDKESEDADE